MKNTIALIFLFLQLSNIISHAQASKKCEYLIKLLCIDEIAEHWDLRDGKLKSIRIVDIDGFFKNCSCEYKLLYIGTINKIPLDINTGRAIDIAILRVKKKKKEMTISFFYALPSQMGMACLWSGEVTFEKKEHELVIKNFRHYIH